MKITHASMQDLAAVAAVEAICFPPAEAATEKDFAGRIQHYGNHFWLMFDGDRLIAFVEGFVTDEADLTDEMYELRMMIAFIEKRALDCRKRLPHSADLFLQFAIPSGQLGRLCRILQELQVGFTLG